MKKKYEYFPIWILLFKKENLSSVIIIELSKYKKTNIIILNRNNLRFGFISNLSSTIPNINIDTEAKNNNTKLVFDNNGSFKIKFLKKLKLKKK